MLRFIRTKTISAIEKQLVNGEVPMTRSLIDQAIRNDEFPKLRSILSKNTGLITPAVKSDLASFIPQDFSVYYLLKDHKFSNDQLALLIRHNPERVDSSWDLFQRHNNGHDQMVSTELIKKLLVDPEEADWARVLYLYNNLHDKTAVEELVFNKLVSAESEKDLSKVSYFPFSRQFLLSKISDLDGVALTSVLGKVLGEDVPYEVYVKAIDTFKEPTADEEFVAHYKKLGNTELSPVSVSVEQIVRQIVDSELDISEKPESLLLRLKLMDYFGMEVKDFDTLLKKYHYYQTHCSFGFDLVQHKLIQAYCLKAVEDNAPEVLPIVDALLPQNIPIKIIQAMILSNSVFDADKGLEIYNQYIKQVSTKANEHTNRSPAGLLNESIILAYLYNNDRDFAHIIFDKVAGSNLLPENEVATIKKVFKVYGDAFEEDDVDKAKVILHKHVATTIKNL